MQVVNTPPFRDGMLKKDVYYQPTFPWAEAPPDIMSHPVPLVNTPTPLRTRRRPLCSLEEKEREREREGESRF